MRAGPGRAAGLGADFAKLWTANTVSNLGDGVTGVAGPLLMASLTGDPAQVAGAALARQLPWLLLSLPSGAYVDRLDRRRLLVAVNLLRGAVLAGLAVTVWSGAVTVPLVYAAFFLLGTGETLADNASFALLPSVVPASELPRANARLMAGYLVGNQLAAGPLGAWLFVVAAALPFGFDAASFVVAAGLVAALRHRREPADAVPRARPRRLRADIAEGVRWLWRQPTLRLLAVCLGLMNLTGAGTFAIWVLWARERLGAEGVGFGVMVTAYAVGGLLGTMLASRLEVMLGAAALLRGGLVVEALSQLSLAVTRTAWVAGATLVLFGAHAMVWGVVTVSLRQRIVPGRLRGRVNSVYFLFDIGGAAFGTLLGGLLARALGITAPFWVAFAAMALLAAAAWRRLTPGALAAPAG
jgi:MFS family permease